MEDKVDTLTLTAEIVAAYVGTNTHVQAADIPAIIRSVRAALTEGDTPVAAPEAESQKVTAAQIRKSITPDGLISFVDNKPYKTLKRHLARHGMTMDDYRQRYGLAPNYPSVAPNYSAARSEMARKLGLGARGRGASPANGGGEGKAPAKNGRRKAAPAS